MPRAPCNCCKYSVTFNANSERLRSKHSCLIPWYVQGIWQSSSPPFSVSCRCLGPLLKWFESYLPNCFQKVMLNAYSSTSLPVHSGVPQGSILGPLLFIIYINSLAELNFSPGTSVVLYADDILLYWPLCTSHDPTILIPASCGVEELSLIVLILSQRFIPHFSDIAHPLHQCATTVPFCVKVTTTTTKLLLVTLSKVLLYLQDHGCYCMLFDTSRCYPFTDVHGYYIHKILVVRYRSCR